MSDESTSDKRTETGTEPTSESSPTDVTGAKAAPAKGPVGPRSTTGSDTAATSPRIAAAPAGFTTTGRSTWLIPALTFLVGLVLGAVVIGVTRSGDGGSTASSADSGSSATASATPSATAPTRDGATIVVPGQCLELADGTQSALDLVTKAAQAARDLSASKLNTVVRQLQDQQSELQTLVTACRSGTSVSSTS